jgi:adhesin transport system membrane fusion protein
MIQRLYRRFLKAKNSLRLFDRILAVKLPMRPSDNLRWDLDADWARLEQEPLRARALLYWGCLAFACLLVWAGFAEIAEVTRGEGKVIPSRQVQIVQSVDGGIVSEILVHEGEIVDVGQVLFRIDPTRFLSSLRENRVQYMALLARAERLKALSEGRPFAPDDERFLKNPAILEHERALYLSNREELEVQLHIANQQLKQRRQELEEAKSRHNQGTQSLDLVTREYTVSKPLAASGAVSEIDLLRLQRELVRLSGDLDQTVSQIKRLQSAVVEAQRNIQEVDLNFRNRIGAELSDVMGKISSLTEGSTALSDRVQHAEVKSPVRGTIKSLFINTLGAVVNPGKEVVEVIPLDDTLLLEARVKPQDIAFLGPGQEALVKFTAYDFAIYGGLKAVVEHIGADTVTDERGNAFYVIRVRTHESGFGTDMPIIPGMVAHVDVISGKKTILNYLLKPVLRAKANALSER